LAAAKLFVKEGAYVFITGRRQKELDEGVKAIGTNVTGVQGDIAKLADLDRLYEAVKSKGRIDVVLANAGVAEFAPLGKITEEQFEPRLHRSQADSPTCSKRSTPQVLGPLPQVATALGVGTTQVQPEQPGYSRHRGTFDIEEDFRQLLPLGVFPLAWKRRVQICCRA